MTRLTVLAALALAGCDGLSVHDDVIIVNGGNCLDSDVTIVSAQSCDDWDVPSAVRCTGTLPGDAQARPVTGCSGYWSASDAPPVVVPCVAACPTKR